jgi:predicted RNA binding protein YcfA (HicA-like mRNA interferase family)
MIVFEVAARSAASEPRRMPPKIRELVAELEGAGFENRGGKGSHRNYVHPRLSKPITIFGKLGDDAKQYQIRAVRTAIAEVER